jgi:hypothetical protein
MIMNWARAVATDTDVGVLLACFHGGADRMNALM